MFLFSFADSPGADAYKRLDAADNQSPEKKSSFINRQTMWWFNTVCALGAKKPLEVSDLYCLNPDDSSAVLVPRWSELWDPAVKKFMKKQKDLEQECRSRANTGSRRGSVVNGDVNGTTPLLSANIDRLGVVRFPS